MRNYCVQRSSKSEDARRGKISEINKQYTILSYYHAILFIKMSFRLGKVPYMRLLLKLKKNDNVKKSNLIHYWRIQAFSQCAVFTYLARVYNIQPLLK